MEGEKFAATPLCESCLRGLTNRTARADLPLTQRLASEAKELIYWALDMDKVFVYGLSAEYSDEADAWRYRHLSGDAVVPAALT